MPNKHLITFFICSLQQTQESSVISILKCRNRFVVRLSNLFKVSLLGRGWAGIFNSVYTDAKGRFELVLLNLLSLLFVFLLQLISELISPKLVEKHTASINAKPSKTGVPSAGPHVNSYQTRTTCIKWWWKVIDDEETIRHLKIP